MKKRNGFVSNSSSSSFIVAVKDTDNLKVTITQEINLKHFESKYEGRITTIERLNEYYEDCYCGDDYKDSKEYQKAKKQIEEGNTLLFLIFSDDDYGVGGMIRDNGLHFENDNIVMVDDRN